MVSIGSVVFFLCGFSVVVASFSASKSDLQIQTSTGTVLGRRPAPTLSKNLKLFLGVPYATPPIGNLRFKPPVPLRTKHVERDATQFAPSCNQPPHLQSVISPLLKPNQAEISEDCLYLNIYVPDNKESTTPFPVMVWLAGEGFDYADPQQFDGSYLAVEGNVIVVTVNYRLSVFGFLTSLSEDAPGNVGLLDQRMALQWVKENIEKFGGDSENVTLFGRFTGSMSAAIHAFSPLNKKEQLFKRVILQSGVPVGDWVFDRNPLNATLSLAATTNCLFTKLSEVVECLRQLPSEQLLHLAMKIPQRFRPVYDFNLIYENSLKAVPKSKYSPVDIMVGINNDEGSLCTIALNAMQSPFYEKILRHKLSESDFDELVTMNMLEFFKEEDILLNKLAAYKYKKHEGHLRKNFVEFCGDIFITSRAQRLADKASQHNLNVYMYEFAHRSSFSIHPSFIRAAHGDDVLYSMGLPLQMTNLPDDEARLTKRVVQAFSNFARTGNPNAVSLHEQWPRYTTEKRELMSFKTFRDKERFVEETTHQDAVTFWYDIIPTAQHRTCPLPPISAALVSSEGLQVDSSGQSTYFLGTHITLPTAKYLMLGLIGVSGFLFVIFIILISLLLKAKNHSFHRLV